MKHKVSFPAGEFEVDCDFSAFNSVEMFQKALLSSNPLFAAAKVEIKIEPVMKSYKITYREVRCNLVLAESSDAACAKLRRELKPGEYYIEEVKEVK